MALQRLALHIAQSGRSFDQRDLRRRQKPGHPRAGAERIGHQRAAPRPKFGEREGRRRALIQPTLRQGEADQLAKHLADLGGGDEIPLRAERRAGRVVAPIGMQQAGLHIVVQPHRSFQCDPRQQMVLQAHAFRRARMMRKTPTAIIGSDRICPMVSPQPPICHASPSGLPGVTNCASGWRRNSTAKRAAP